MVLIGVFLFIDILLCMGIAWLYGRQKVTGFWWTLFFCFTLSPPIGFAIARLSRPVNASVPVSEFKFIVMLVISFFLVMGGVLLLIASFVLTHAPCYLLLCPGAGLTGAGIFGISRLPAGIYEEE